MMGKGGGGKVMGKEVIHNRRRRKRRKGGQTGRFSTGILQLEMRKNDVIFVLFVVVVFF